MKQLAKFSPILFFAVITLSIIYPLLPPGFIVTLDLPPIEKPIIPEVFSNYFLINILFYILNFVIPNYAVQKLVLFSILLLSYWGMYRLVPAKSQVAKIFAAVFYMANPFIYARLVTGQWLLALGYAVFPWVVSAIKAFFENPKWGNIVYLAILITILSNISSHFLFLASLFFLLYLITLSFIRFESVNRILSSLPLVAGITIVLNINWLAGFILGNQGLGMALSNFTSEDLLSFQSAADPSFGLLYNLLAGFGFWPEIYGYFLSPKSLIPFWPVITLVLLCLSLYGFYLMIKRKEEISFSVTFSILFLISLDLAAGIALLNFQEIIVFLYEKIIFLRGFREPQKFVAIIMFFYAYFASVGLEEINKKLVGNKRLVLTGLLLFLPIVYSLPILGGFWGQLSPVFYPSSWGEVKKILNEDKDEFGTVFFPWHQYMRFNFTNNMVVSNPAPYYFAKPIISSQNYETKYIGSKGYQLETLHVEGLLSIEKDRENLLGEKVYESVEWAKDLSSIDVKYIILAKEEDWKSYRFLDRSGDLKKIYESDEIDLYQNLKWGIESPIEENIEEYNIQLPLED